MRIDDLFRQPRRRRLANPMTLLSRRAGKWLAGIVIAGAAALFGLRGEQAKTPASQSSHSTQSVASNVNAADPNYAALQAIAQNRELPYVEIHGAEVIRLLRADNRGARHQRWMIQLSGGQSVMVVHNIDLAEKVPVAVGDTIDVAGELVYSDRKREPLIHWTHADPRQRRKGGFILHNGIRYGEITEQKERNQ